MRGSEWDRADEEKRQTRIFADVVVLRFKSGWDIKQICAAYNVEDWLVLSILRDHITG